MIMYDYRMISRLYHAAGSAFFLFYPDQLTQNASRLHDAFARRYEQVAIAYSYKTNYLPYLCTEMDRWGAYAEVVSRLEYQLAETIGVEPQRIIFNGPLKDLDDICLALDNKSMLHLDSFYEIDHVKHYREIRPDQPIRVGLRVNFDLSKNGHSPLQNGYQRSRFGFCVENGSLREAISRLRQIPNLTINGLHAHFSTNRSLEVYERITSHLCQLGRTWLGQELEYIDVGGGFYGPLPDSFGVDDPPSFDDYARVICDTVSRQLTSYGLTPLLILEPGVSLVADTFHFICQVIDLKQIGDQTFVLVDGSVHNVKPTMHKKPLPVQVIRQNNNDNRQSEQLFHVVGYTCMEKDYLSENCLAPLPQPGDFLQFGHVGAYTIVFQPPFIRERPPIVAASDGGYLLVRKKERFDQFFPDQLREYHHELLLRDVRRGVDDEYSAL
ncbi:diaminopimelate decarboxylase [Brevibacillus humidisoli]|uniref:diaminopimelate decarboxylase n=1 Tax=Brevibacillus humidisoli TaxID=2895522 RepID=UPI001E386645|nr:diaminopimelate decarboxylase [Brevibacillus humidisoli]UFJ42504.1 diaminopimelate decarboxylase [Brevibacillus humidisoli]